MSAVSQAPNTYAQIELLVRRLTACSSESALPTVQIQEQVNTFYNSDFPLSIKTDQMRSVYTFYTQPYIDRYPLDVNYNQGIRAPMYVDGIQGYLYKDRWEFYNLWPRWPTSFNQYGVVSSQISGISNANPAQVTTALNGLVTGDKVGIFGVNGMTEVNGNIYTITVTGAGTFTLNGVDSTTFGVYTSGGKWVKESVTLTIPGPFLSEEVLIGTVSYSGSPININDDGNGNLQLKMPNPQVSVPPQTTNPAVPGMYNLNTANPGLINPLNIGSVNYVTGAIVIDFSLGNVIPDPSLTLRIRVSQYQTGRPYSLLFWNNEFRIRPIPKYIHKVEIETYLTPVQFMLSTDSPILDEWVQYISYGCAIEILRQRQDMEGVANLMEGFQKQEAQVLERQAVEEINSRNSTIFAGTQQNQGWNNGFNSGWY